MSLIWHQWPLKYSKCLVLFFFLTKQSAWCAHVILFCPSFGSSSFENGRCIVLSEQHCPLIVSHSFSSAYPGSGRGAATQGGKLKPLSLLSLATLSSSSGGDPDPVVVVGAQLAFQGCKKKSRFVPTGTSLCFEKETTHLCMESWRQSFHRITCLLSAWTGAYFIHFVMITVMMPFNRWTVDPDFSRYVFLTIFTAVKPTIILVLREIFYNPRISLLLHGTWTTFYLKKSR